MLEMENIFQFVAMQDSVASVYGGCADAFEILTRVNNAKMTSVRYRLGAKDKFIADWRENIWLMKIIK